LRVLRWILDRCESRVGARETPIGFLPNADDIDTSGLDVDAETMDALLSVNVEQWKLEMESVGDYLQSFGDRLPEGLQSEYHQVVEDLRKAG
jgi:phosphoenolpyruvate carboxykinase (GTP)